MGERVTASMRLISLVEVMYLLRSSTKKPTRKGTRMAIQGMVMQMRTREARQ